MNGSKPGAQDRKSKIAARVRNVNVILFTLIIAVIAIVAAAIISELNSSVLPDSDHSYSIITKILPLLFVMVAALLLYVIVQNVLMRRFIFTPLNRLTREITDGNPGENIIYGSSRDDEIGILARTIWDTTQAIERRDSIMSAGNRCAALLLRAIMDEEMLDSTVLQSMEIIGRCMDVDRVHLWRNETIDGVFCFVHRREWLSDMGQQKAPIPIDMKFPYSDIPEWKDTFLRSEHISGPLSAQTENTRNFLNAYQIKSIMIIPLFLQDQFWGFFSLDDCRQERSFLDDEINTLRSVGLMLASSLLRNKMTQDVRDTAAKLEAVISNYSGIIWSVDKNNNITLLNGMYIKDLGVTPERYEGWKLDDAQEKNRRLEIIANVQKTFEEGPQDWISETDGKMFHSHNTLIFDNNDRVTGVVGSIDDITEMARLQDKLEAALKEAQSANQAKSDFLAKMSHEMRTPLNAVLGLSELTLEFEGLNEEALANIDKINNAGATLLSTVNDILDISKIEAGKLELVQAEYDMPSLLNDTITQSIMHIGEKPIQFLLDIDENLPARLYGDELRIRQIFNNLLSNAFKYTKEGTVTLEIKCLVKPDVQRNGDESPSHGSVLLTVCIRDTGLGIRPENMGKLFDDYSRMETKVTHMIIGTGLGLPITKRLLELMGGTITVQSEYGKGSVFTVQFSQECVNDNIIGREVVDSLKNFHYIDKKRLGSFRHKRIRLPYAKVLVVDDVVTNLDVAKGLMKPYGMQIDCAGSGQEAIDIVCHEKVRYNAIFMDHMMPVMDGIEATRIIREIGTDYAKTVPIIALTANAIIGNEEMFLGHGFQAFLSKPIEIPRLDAVIKEWVRDKEQEKLLPDIQEGGQDNSLAAKNSEPDDRASGAADIKIAGLDIKKGIERFGGDGKSYFEILRSYTSNIPALLEKTKGVNRDNLDDYTVTVHGIKGSSRGINADVAGNQAEALEKAGKAGDLDFITANNPAFLKTVKRLVDDINAMLEKIDAGNTKSKKDKPDDNTLLQLAAACEKFDMDGVDSAMAALEGFEYQSGGELVEWLRSNVDMMNLKQIIERLSAQPGEPL